MAGGPPITTKSYGEGHVFHTSQQAMIKTYYSMSIMENYDKKV